MVSSGEVVGSLRLEMEAPAWVPDADAVRICSIVSAPPQSRGEGC